MSNEMLDAFRYHPDEGFWGPYVSNEMLDAFRYHPDEFVEINKRPASSDV